MQQSLSYILFHSYSGEKRRRESLNEIYHSTRWKQRAPFATRPEVGKSARAATYKISIYRIFPLQWGLMSVILPRRKKSRCLRFKEDPLPKRSRAPFPTFYPRKYLQRDSTRGSIIFEFVCILGKEREESSFLLSLLYRVCQ